MQSRVFAIILVVAVAIACGVWFHGRGSVEEVAGTPDLMAAHPPVEQTTAEKEVAAVPPSTPVPALVHEPARHGLATKPAIVIDPNLQSRFDDLKSDALKTIPTQKQIAALSDEEIHMTPAVIVKASVAIGRVSQLVFDHPELSSESLQFYRECAENAESPDSIRAACYLDFTDLKTKSGVASPEPKVPDQVKHLAELAK